jgi:lysozyme
MNPKNKWLLGLAGAALVSGAASLEGTKTTPYKDIGGIPTVCTGHTGTDVKMGVKWTPAQCTEVLKQDLVKHGKGILECVNVPLTENQYNAFTLFAFNVGVGAFCKSSSVLKPLNEGKYSDACNGMYKWVYVNGKYVQGLYNRRKVEVAMCKGELK